MKPKQSGMFVFASTVRKRLGTRGPVSRTLFGKKGTKLVWLSYSFPPVLLGPRLRTGSENQKCQLAGQSGGIRTSTICGHRLRRTMVAPCVFEKRSLGKRQVQSDAVDTKSRDRRRATDVQDR